MSFTWRLAVLTLASFGVANLVVSLVVPFVWRRGIGEGAPAAVRADRLLWLRLAPSIAALGGLVFAATGLVRFETRDAGESVGFLLHAAAALGLALLIVTVCRLLAARRATHRWLADWLAGAEPIDLPGLAIPGWRVDADFPLVAVVGVWRPRLVIARSVLDACSPAEMAAILAHERGHLRRLDNLRRAVFAAAPDALAWTTLPARMHVAWRDATEEAADDAAASQAPEMRAALAAALVRVARLAAAAPEPSLADLPASALYRGEGRGVERRVRRLVDDRPNDLKAPRALPWSTALCAAISCTAWLLQPRLHEVMERVIAALP